MDRSVLYISRHSIQSYNSHFIYSVASIHEIEIKSSERPPPPSSHSELEILSRYLIPTPFHEVKRAIKERISKYFWIHDTVKQSKTEKVVERVKGMRDVSAEGLFEGKGVWVAVRGESMHIDWIFSGRPVHPTPLLGLLPHTLVPPNPEIPWRVMYMYITWYIYTSWRSAHLSTLRVMTLLSSV